MSETNGNGKNFGTIIVSTALAVVAALMTSVLSTSSDRYTGAQAARDWDRQDKRDAKQEERLRDTEALTNRLDERIKTGV